MATAQLVGGLWGTTNALAPPHRQLELGHTLRRVTCDAASADAASRMDSSLKKAIIQGFAGKPHRLRNLLRWGTPLRVH